jgi:hypothetical protein
MLCMHSPTSKLSYNKEKESLTLHLILWLHYNKPYVQFIFYFPYIHMVFVMLSFQSIQQKQYQRSFAIMKQKLQQIIFKQTVVQEVLYFHWTVPSKNIYCPPTYHHNSRQARKVTWKVAGVILWIKFEGWLALSTHEKINKASNPSWTLHAFVPMNQVTDKEWKTENKITCILWR